MRIIFIKLVISVFCWLFINNSFNGCEPIVKIVPVRKMVDAFTEVQYGNMPLIISVPHGGTLNPDSIPDRACSDIINISDLNTIELAFAIDSVSKKDYGIQPYFIISHLKRIKLDQNRDFPEASCNNNKVFNFWKNYHESIDTCIELITAKYSQCLFIDLHGHGHTKQRLEMGYLVNGNSLRNPSSIIPLSTSVYNLLRQNNSLSVIGILTGPKAFGTLMENNGLPSVPGAGIPAPDIDDPYEDGGYNTSVFTGPAYPAVFGWQIESNKSGVRDSKTSMDIFAKAFMKSVMQFYTANTSLKLSSFGK